MDHSNNNLDLVSVHTRLDATTEKLDLFTDHGRFANDLAHHGLELVITNKDSFTNNTAKTVTRSLTDGSTSYDDVDINPRDIHAMYGRLISPVTRPQGSETIPKINSNELKKLASSKFELYTRVLSEEQVPTWFISMQPDDYETSVKAIEAIAGTNVVLKANKGSGGQSTKISSKHDAIAWINAEMLKPEPTAQILQAQINFGPIPNEVNAVSDYGKSLIERARREGLLSELRMFTIKRDDEFDTIPVLRIVPDKSLPMQGHNDDYIDVNLPDELYNALKMSSIRIADKVCEEVGGDRFAIGAVDYYFDYQGLPRVGEANFRSPQLPTTNETPVAGRGVFRSMAKTLHAMTEQ